MEDLNVTIVSEYRYRYHSVSSPRRYKFRLIIHTYHVIHITCIQSVQSTWPKILISIKRLQWIPVRTNVLFYANFKQMGKSCVCCRSKVKRPSTTSTAVSQYRYHAFHAHDFGSHVGNDSDPKVVLRWIPVCIETLLQNNFLHLQFGYVSNFKSTSF